jgi:hypothetical protein
MAKNPRPAKGDQPAASQTDQVNKQPDKFVLPQQAAVSDQWADIFHIQHNPLGVRLWFGTTRGDSTGQTDIRAAVFLPGEVGRLFLAHARTMAEAKKITLAAKAPPSTFN